MELLKKLIECNAPSGRENQIRKLIKTEAEKLEFEVSTDGLGSLIAHKFGNGKKIMFDAHMDEIGIIATFIDDKGFIRFSSVGGLYIKELQKRRVRFLNGVPGIIGSEEENFNEKADISKLYVDIGAYDKKTAENMVRIGDMAVFEGMFEIFGDTVISKTLDDRVGCYMLLKTMEAIRKEECENDLYFVFSTQEEVGLRGAKTATFSIMPDYAIAVDVTDTGDTPSCPAMDVKMSHGAAIKVMDHSVMCDLYTVETLVQLANDNNIKYQKEIMIDGGTDAGAAALTGNGVRACGISLPTRYIHSPSEMASIKDIESCIALLKAACRFKW